jgi:hypothetical protein
MKMSELTAFDVVNNLFTKLFLNEELPTEHQRVSVNEPRYAEFESEAWGYISEAKEWYDETYETGLRTETEHLEYVVFSFIADVMIMWYYDRCLVSSLPMTTIPHQDVFLRSNESLLEYADRVGWTDLTHDDFEVWEDENLILQEIQEFDENYLEIIDRILPEIWGYIERIDPKNPFRNVCEVITRHITNEINSNSEDERANYSHSSNLHLYEFFVGNGDFYQNMEDIIYFYHHQKNFFTQHFVDELNGTLWVPPVSDEPYSPPIPFAPFKNGGLLYQSEVKLCEGAKYFADYEPLGE